jgi:hypothetical protein
VVILGRQPSNNSIHLRQKRTLAGALGGEFESGGGKADLFDVDTTFLRRDWLTGFRRYSLEALNAKHPQPPSCGLSTLHFVLESALFRFPIQQNKIDRIPRLFLM